MYLFVMLPNRERTCPVNLPLGVNVMGLIASLTNCLAGLRSPRCKLSSTHYLKFVHNFCERRICANSSPELSELLELHDILKQIRLAHSHSLIFYAIYLHIKRRYLLE
jgi:hypothetical protein